MSLVNRLINYVKRIRSRFLRLKRNRDTMNRIQDNKEKQLKDVEEKIEALVKQKEINDEDLNTILEEKTLIELGNELSFNYNDTNFDIAIVEDEIKDLNHRLLQLKVEQAKIKNINLSSKIVFQKQLDSLEKNFGKTDRTFKLPRNWNKNKSDVKSIDDIFEKNSLAKIYRKRELEREKVEQATKQEIERLIKIIQGKIRSKKFKDTKEQLGNLRKLISSLRNLKHKTKYQKRLSELTKLLQKTEIEEEKKRQAKELEKKRKEAERKRKEEEKRRKEAKEAQEKIDKEERERQEELEKERQYLESLSTTKKDNWEDFRAILQNNNISILYHFTDISNITSIKRNGGLYSWSYCDKKSIIINKPGGGTLSRDLDRRYNLQDYVRLSFTRNHPMMYVARNEGRIPNPIVLKVSTEVVYWINTMYSDMNATKTGHSVGSSIEYLHNIHFDTVRQNNHFDLSDTEKKYYQAEILVKTWIPIEYITNINDF